MRRSLVLWLMPLVACGSDDSKGSPDPEPTQSLDLAVGDVGEMTLDDTGVMVLLTGVLWDNSDEDWYRVQFTNSAGDHDYNIEMLFNPPLAGAAVDLEISPAADQFGTNTETRTGRCRPFPHWLRQLK